MEENDEPYIGVPLSEYVHLTQIRTLLEILRENGLDEWENWPTVVEEFLSEENIDPDEL